MSDQSNLSNVLIVDDDPVTLQFFRGALSRLARCAIANDGATAQTRAERDVFDLLIIDLNLPDMRGEQLLKNLRKNQSVAHAIATSAEVDAHVRKKIMACGFDDIIEKPVALGRLLAIVGNYLDRAESPTLLDDETGLKSLGGDRTSLHALRGLLAIELDDMQTKYAGSAIVDHEELSARLHRLRASCGFCGANALASAAIALQQSLRTNRHVDRTDMTRFLVLCSTTAKALRS